MDQRMIAVIGAFDQNGVYGIGLHMPWEKDNGKSNLKLDASRFQHLTKEITPTRKKSILICGRSTAESRAFQMRPLPSRRLVVISKTLNEKEINEGRGEDEKITVAAGIGDAREKALAFEDCGNIFFMGGHGIWERALMFHLCTHAFITVVKCDSVARSPYKGEICAALEMVRDETYDGMKLAYCDTFTDKWGDDNVEIETRTYMVPCKQEEQE